MIDSIGICILVASVIAQFSFIISLAREPGQDVSLGCVAFSWSLLLDSTTSMLQQNNWYCINEWSATQGNSRFTLFVGVLCWVDSARAASGMLWYMLVVQNDWLRCYVWSVSPLLKTENLHSTELKYHMWDLLELWSDWMRRHVKPARSIKW